MDGEYGMYRKGSSGWSSMFGNEEFQESDVWSVLKERQDFVKPKGSSSNSLITSRSTISLPNAARMIPRPSSTNPDIETRVLQQQSAPVSIPDWSKIYGKSKNTTWLDHDDDDDNINDDGHDRRGSWDSDEDDDDGNDDGNMMPPHEWIAKKLARSQISSFSVCEGAGRTLKGRDLSRVRHAVLTKTGFLE